jgi:hypothetical protein
VQQAQSRVEPGPVLLNGVIELSSNEKTQIPAKFNFIAALLLSAARPG